LSLPASAVISPALISPVWILICFERPVAPPCSALAHDLGHRDGLQRSSIWPASIFDRSRMSLIKPSRCSRSHGSREETRAVGRETPPSGASIKSSEKTRMAVAGRPQLVAHDARTRSCAVRINEPDIRVLSWSMRCLRSSAVANALMNCCTRLTSSPPRPGEKDPEDGQRTRA